MALHPWGSDLSLEKSHDHKQNGIKTVKEGASKVHGPYYYFPAFRPACPCA
jgi:hypothetical protein